MHEKLCVELRVQVRTRLRLSTQLNAASRQWWHHCTSLRARKTRQSLANDELPFARHLTISAAAYVLGLSRKGDGSRNGRFTTKAGPVIIFMSRDGDRGEGTLPVVSADIPHNVHIHAYTIGDLVRPILGLSSIPEIRKAELKAPIVSIVKGMKFLLIELKNLVLLREVKMVNPEVDFHGLLKGEWDERFVSKYYFVVLGEEEGVVRVRTRMLEVTMEDLAIGSVDSALSTWLSLKGGERGRSSGSRRLQPRSRIGGSAWIELQNGSKDR
jgi:predicted PhzF superfamily epimerase YddE/YHI9